SGASACARVRVRGARPAFERAFGTEFPAAMIPATEPMLTIAPLAWRNAGTAARLRYQGPIRFTPRIRRHNSSSAPSRSENGTRLVVPALLTRASRRPNRASAVATRRCASSSRETSPCTYTAAGSERASISPSSTERDELRTIWAPSLANRSATARPIPLDDPVTTTTSLTPADPTAQASETARRDPHSRPVPRHRADAEPGRPSRAALGAGGDRARL